MVFPLTSVLRVPYSRTHGSPVNMRCASLIRLLLEDIVMNPLALALGIHAAAWADRCGNHKKCF
jgi:hypothetical protein